MSTNTTHNHSYRVLASEAHYVTLTGRINPQSDNGGIGPSIMAVEIVETTDTVTGQVFQPTYSVAFDGHYQCSGFADHWSADAAFVRSMAIVHARIAS